MSGGSVVSVICPLASGWMPRNVIRRQALQLLRRRLNRLPALLDIAAELERQPRRLLVQRLQAVARRLVLVHAGQPIAQQRALHVMLRRRARAVQLDRRQRVIHLAIQAQRAARHRHALRLHLRLVAHRLVGGNGIQNPRLRSRQAQVLDRRIVEPQRVLRGARPFNRQQRGQCASCAASRALTQAVSASGDAAPPASQA